MLIMQNQMALLAKTQLQQVYINLIKNSIRLIGNSMFLWRKLKEPLQEHIQQ